MIDEIKEDLNSTIHRIFDVVKVYRPTRPDHCQFNKDAYTKGILMFDRAAEENKPLVYPNGKTAEENFRDMWNWLADHSDKGKKDWFNEFWDEEWEMPKGLCFACDVCGQDCNICPLGENNIGCLDGLFYKWASSKGYERANYAHQIANLEWKEK